MRFLHLGDVHLAEGPNLDDTVQALRQVTDIAHREKVDAVLCPGDIFDKKSSPTERQAFRRFILDLDPISLICCKGNHDQPGDLLVYDLARNVQVYERPELLNFGDTDILILPWPERAHIAALGHTGEGGLQTAQQALSELILAMAATRDTSRPLVIMGHLSVCGAITSSGQPLVGREIQVVLGDLEDTGAAYVALNHIHKPQQMGGAVYAGSLTIQDFGEEGESKGVVLVDVTPEGSNWWTVPINGREWVTVDAHLKEIHRDDTKEAIGKFVAESRSSEPNANVRYRYSCDEADANLFDHAEIARRFSSAHSLKIEPKVTRTQRVRAAEVAEAKTVADKVVAWGAATETEITEGMLSKLHNIQGGA